MFNKIKSIKYIVFILLIFLFSNIIAIDGISFSNSIINETSFKNEVSDNISTVRVYDFANLLTEEEINFLTKQSLQFDNYNLTMLFLTVSDTDGKTTKAYIDSFHDAETYGVNSVLFVIDLDNEIVYINTTGYCIEILTNNSVEYILENTYYYAKQGKYYDFFKEASNLSTNFITKNASKSYTVPSVLSLALSLTISLLVIIIFLYERNISLFHKNISPNKIEGEFKILTKDTIFIGDKTNISQDFYQT